MISFAMLRKYDVQTKQRGAPNLRESDLYVYEAVWVLAQGRRGSAPPSAGKVLLDRLWICPEDERSGEDVQCPLSGRHVGFVVSPELVVADKEYVADNIE
jgi:hypothetical protein